MCTAYIHADHVQPIVLPGQHMQFAVQGQQHLQPARRSSVLLQAVHDTRTCNTLVQSFCTAQTLKLHVLIACAAAACGHKLQGAWSWFVG